MRMLFNAEVTTSEYFKAIYMSQNIPYNTHEDSI